MQMIEHTRTLHQMFFRHPESNVELHTHVKKSHDPLIHAGDLA